MVWVVGIRVHVYANRFGNPHLAKLETSWRKTYLGCIDRDQSDQSMM